MGQSLVRCPFCDRRYNVTGIPPGTKVLCTACRGVLSVPAPRQPAREPLWRRVVPQTPSSQFVTALVGGLLVASGGCVAFRAARTQPAVIDKAPSVAAAPAKEADRPVTREEAKRQIATFLSPDFDPSRFLYHDAPPFLMVAEKSDRVWMMGLFDYHRPALDLLYQTFMREFREPLGLRDIKNEILPVVIFTSRESFDAYCRKAHGKQMPPEIPGVYEYHNRRIVMVYDRAQAPLEVLMHEGTHQLIHFYTLDRGDGRRKPTYWWFQEGLGTYFESMRRDGQGALVTAPPAHANRIKVVQETLKDRRDTFLPLSMLMGMTVDDFWSKWYTEARDEKEQQERTKTAQLAYGEACALVLFLRHGENGKYRVVFDEYFAHELKGEGSRPKFEEILRRHYPAMDLGILQDQFTKYVESLER